MCGIVKNDLLKKEEIVIWEVPVFFFLGDELI